MWIEACGLSVRLPRKSIGEAVMAPTLQLLPRLHAIIMRLSPKAPGEATRALSHADVVVASSIATNMHASLASPSEQVIARLVTAGTNLVSDEEVLGDGPGGWYATTKRHLDWVYERTSDLGDRRMVDAMRARFYVSLSNPQAYASWVRTVKEIESKVGPMWTNTVQSAMKLGQLLAEAGRAQATEADDAQEPEAQDPEEPSGQGAPDLATEAVARVGRVLVPQ
jgi:hypothetical protein